MRRMKEMSALQGGMMSFYGEMPDSYNLVVNTAHPVIEKLLSEEENCLWRRSGSGGNWTGRSESKTR